MNGPIPIPSRCWSVAGVVMLFHSPMSRMKKTLPDAVDGESEPNTASWRSHHGAITSRNNPTHANAADQGIARRRHRSHRKASPSAPRTSNPSLRDNVATPASRPAAANDRGEPLSPRAPIHSDARTSGWNSEKLSGWTMYTTDSTGTAMRIPAPRATRADARASRAIAHVSGAANDPMSANGRADAQGVSPRIQMNGTWMTDASGIQCAFEGIGSTGFAGMVPPTSGKIQMRSMLKP